MRRKDLLFITGCAEKHFESLQRRDQLPFGTTGRAWGQYSLEDAFRLQLMLNLLAHSPRHEDSGLVPDFAVKVVWNCLSKAGEMHGRTDPFAFVGASEAAWIGAAEFSGMLPSGEAEFFTRWFYGTLSDLSLWSAEILDREGAEYRNAHMSRMSGLTNVSATAVSVISRADEIGLLGPDEGWGGNV